MLKRILIIICLLFVTMNFGMDRVLNKRIFSINGGLENVKVMHFDIAWGFETLLLGLNAEIGIGILNRNYTLDIKSVDMDVMSAGIYVEAIVYVFEPLNFFLGVRWDVMTFNYFTPGARDDFDDARLYMDKYYDIPEFFFGTSLFLKGGFKIAFSDKFKIALTGYVGYMYTPVNSGGFENNWGTGPNSFTEKIYTFIYAGKIGLNFYY